MRHVRTQTFSALEGTARCPADDNHGALKLTVLRLDVVLLDETWNTQQGGHHILTQDVEDVTWRKGVNVDNTRDQRNAKGCIHLELIKTQNLKIHKSPATGCKLHVSPFDIAPVSCIKKKSSNRRRKACKSQVITLSPYKNDLEQSLSTPTKPPLKRKVFRKPQPTRGTSKKQKKSDADSDEDSNAANESIVPADDDTDIDDIGQIVPDDKDATCLFCDGRFSEDHREELWVRCLMCNMWAHEHCSGAEKDNYGIFGTCKRNPYDSGALLLGSLHSNNYPRRINTTSEPEFVKETRPLSDKQSGPEITVALVAKPTQWMYIRDETTFYDAKIIQGLN
ncbi:hypothetical protein FQA39_LY06397 [Lamprigera yunnana]|nr:hypothetical protein FQA39_LY06397 [Lamprigera yunnana]